MVVHWLMGTIYMCVTYIYMQTIHNELENVLQLVYIVGAKLFCVCWEPLYVLIPKLTSVVLLVVGRTSCGMSLSTVFTHTKILFGSLQMPTYTAKLSRWGWHSSPVCYFNCSHWHVHNCFWAKCFLAPPCLQLLVTSSALLKNIPSNACSLLCPQTPHCIVHCTLLE